MPTPRPAPDGAEGMLVATDTLYAYVSVSAGSSLTLRRAASTASAAVGYLTRGTRVTMLAFDDDWACVRAPSGVTGFAARRYLYLPGSSSGGQPVVEDVPREPEKFREKKTGITVCNRAALTRSATELYRSYSTDSAVLARLPASTKVRVTAFSKKWAYVAFGGRNGFVLLKDLKAV